MVNPPPLHAMSYWQKMGRIFLFSTTLIMISVLSSMLAAVGIFTLQHVRHMMSGAPQLLGDIAIILVCMLINTLCVMVLLKVKNADQRLIPPTEPPTKPEIDSP